MDQAKNELAALPATATQTLPVASGQSPKAKELTEAQIRAARLIAMGMDYKAVAGELGITRVTLYRWRKIPIFIKEVSGLIESAREETRGRVVRDVSEVQDLVLDTLIDVARNDSSGSARVAAARTLKEYMDEAQRRADEANNDLMADRSGEIKAILEHIRGEKADSLPPSSG